MKRLYLLLFILLFGVSSISYADDINDRVRNYIRDTTNGLYVIQIESNEFKYQMWKFDKLNENEPEYHEYLVNENNKVKGINKEFDEDYKLIKLFEDYKNKQEIIGFNMQSDKVRLNKVNFNKADSKMNEMIENIQKAFDKIDIEISDFKEPVYVEVRYVTYGNIHSLIAEYNDKDNKNIYKFSIFIRKDTNNN